MTTKTNDTGNITIRRTLNTLAFVQARVPWPIASGMLASRRLTRSGEPPTLDERDGMALISGFFSFFDAALLVEPAYETGVPMRWR